MINELKNYFNFYNKKKLNFHINNIFKFIQLPIIYEQIIVIKQENFFLINLIKFEFHL